MVDSAPQFLFYTTSHCHLCDDAMAILQQLHLSEPVSLDMVDIVESDELVDTYGERIPVLKRASDGEELGWPFDAQQALTFLQN